MSKTVFDPYLIDYEQTSQDQERRNTPVIKRDFQRIFVFQAMAFTFVLVNSLLILSILLSHSDLPNLYQQLILYPGIAVAEVLGLIIIFFLARKISHAIAGPIYRFDQTLHAVKQGDLTANAILRKSDYFQDSAEILNETIDKLRLQIEGMQRTADQLREELPHDTQAKRVAEALHRKLQAFNTDENPTA